MPELMPVDNLDDFIAAPYHPTASKGRVAIVEISKVAAQLAAYRTDCEFTQAEVAQNLDWSESKVSRIEHGQVSPSVTDVIALLAIYGLTDKAKKSELEGRVRANRKQRPTNPYRELVSLAQAQYLEYEPAAVEGIWQHDSTAIPEVMQTSGYADAHNAIFRPDDDTGTRAVLARLRSQRAAYLLGKYGPPLRFIIDEGALLRPEGNASVLPDQKYIQLRKIVEGLKRLNTAGQALPPDSQLNPNITIQIAPFRMGTYPPTYASYSILNIPQIAPVVYNYHYPVDGVFSHNDPEKGEWYKSCFDEFANHAPHPSQTNGILDAVLDALTSVSPRSSM